MAALLDVATTQAAERVAQNDSPQFRSTALSTYEEAFELFAKGSTDRAGEKLRELGALLKRGADEDEAWDLLMSRASRLAALLQKHWQVSLAKKQAIPANELSAILARLAEDAIRLLPRDEALRWVGHMDRTFFSDQGRVSQN